MDLGPTGETVAYNVRRLRGERTYKEVSEQLGKIGRPIPPLAVRRIEEGARRVDADDLLALAVVLGVNPSALLFPPAMGSDIMLRTTGIKQHVPSEALWDWATGTQALGFWDPMWSTQPETGSAGESRLEYARRVFQLRAQPKGFSEFKTPNVGPMPNAGKISSTEDAHGNN